MKIAATWLRGVVVATALFSASGARAAEPPPTFLDECKDVGTSYDVSQCMGRALKEFDLRLEVYLKTAEQRIAGSETLSYTNLLLEQRAFAGYRDAYCGTQDDFWLVTAARRNWFPGCYERLTRQRMHDVWVAYLIGPDLPRPLLPEP